MLRINMLLKSGDAPQEFFDRHTSKVRHIVGLVKIRSSAKKLTPEWPTIQDLRNFYATQ